MLAGLTLGELAERARALGRVYITTMISSKGLEFDVIVMLGVEDGKIPFFGSRGAALEEDRRKFYVSLTGAGHAVHISTRAGSNGGVAARSTMTARADFSDGLSAVQQRVRVRDLAVFVVGERG